MATKPTTFQVIGAAATTTAWTGAPQTIVPPNTLAMSPTTAGSMVFAYQNTGTSNNAGKLLLTSGASQPQNLPVPALLAQPSILVYNWGGNNLNVFNASIVAGTPIWVEAAGPGLPGQTPVPLVIGTPLSMNQGTFSQGTTNPNWMQLGLQSKTSTLTIVAFIGGPADASGNNAYVVALNSSSGNTGPGFGPAPQGYFATTSGNAWSYEFNWGASVIWLWNLSPSTASPVTATLTSL
jgi:hypothetical protein